MSLDRTPDGIEHKCCECRRPFRGEAWMDYCAECHAEAERNSPLNKDWACLTCNTTFRLGTAKLPKAPGEGFECPNCKSGDTHPADGSVTHLTEYFGEIGTRN